MTACISIGYWTAHALYSLPSCLEDVLAVKDTAQCSTKRQAFSGVIDSRHADLSLVELLPCPNLQQTAHTPSLTHSHFRHAVLVLEGVPNVNQAAESCMFYTVPGVLTDNRHTLQHQNCMTRAVQGDGLRFDQKHKPYR